MGNLGTDAGLEAGQVQTDEAADVQTHTVKVTSTQDAMGFDIAVKETGSNTGVFEATFQTGPATVFLLQGGILETDIRVDLNGNGATTDTVTVNAGSPVSEVTARVDADGDGLTTGVLDVLGVDLNGDGDALDAGVDSVNVAGLPDSPTGPVIAVSDGTVATPTCFRQPSAPTPLPLTRVRNLHQLLYPRQPLHQYAAPGPSHWIKTP